MAGAPAGNNNAGRNKPFWRAIDKAIAQDDGTRLRAAAERLLDLAANGTPWAVRELADRLDGKPVTQTEISGPDGGPIETKNKLEIGFVPGRDSIP